MSDLFQWMPVRSGGAIPVHLVDPPRDPGGSGAGFLAEFLPLIGSPMTDPHAGAPSCCGPAEGEEKRSDPALDDETLIEASGLMVVPVAVADPAPVGGGAQVMQTQADGIPKVDPAAIWRGRMGLVSAGAETGQTIVAVAERVRLAPGDMSSVPALSPEVSGMPPVPVDGALLGPAPAPVIASDAIGLVPSATPSAPAKGEPSAGQVSTVGAPQLRPAVSLFATRQPGEALSKADAPMPMPVDRLVPTDDSFQHAAVEPVATVRTEAPPRQSAVGPRAGWPVAEAGEVDSAAPSARLAMPHAPAMPVLSGMRFGSPAAVQPADDNGAMARKDVLSVPPEAEVLVTSPGAEPERILGERRPAAQGNGLFPTVTKVSVQSAAPEMPTLQAGLDSSARSGPSPAPAMAPVEAVPGMLAPTAGSVPRKPQAEASAVPPSATPPEVRGTILPTLPAKPVFPAPEPSKALVTASHPESRLVPVRAEGGFPPAQPEGTMLPSSAAPPAETVAPPTPIVPGRPLENIGPASGVLSSQGAAPSDPGLPPVGLVPVPEPGPAARPPDAAASLQASSGSPVPTADAITRQIGDAVRRGPLREGGVIDIALDPPELGRLRLSLVEVNGAFSLSIAVERPETAELMRRHIGLLAQEFGRIGLETPSVDISHGGADGRSEGRTQPARTDVLQGPIPEATQDAPKPTNAAAPSGNRGLDLRL